MPSPHIGSHVDCKVHICPIFQSQKMQDEFEDSKSHPVKHPKQLVFDPPEHPSQVRSHGLHSTPSQ